MDTPSLPSLPSLLTLMESAMMSLFIFTLIVVLPAVSCSMNVLIFSPL